MAFSSSVKPLFFVIALLCISTFCCKSEDEDYGDTGDTGVQVHGNENNEVDVHGSGNGVQGGDGVEDPAQIVAKALYCFNDRFVYSSCKESYRLTQSGNINVPPEATDEYCSGACLTETHLVLDCINNILSNFLFYNKATIWDIKATIKAGCSDTDERGNFNVAEHLESNDGHKATMSYALFYVYIFIMFLLGWYLVL
ncbi:hypothetical protein MKW94_004924 [Papaver nudicaule]|uniref:DUF7731 domain-containing protein n=1 Tax=Papaver nudicaule TaxID=74823 RepID=A0AA41VG92_PAPNU|nr:hypothetical protein [Papaver nudicaule]